MVCGTQRHFPCCELVAYWYCCALACVLGIRHRNELDFGDQNVGVKISASYLYIFSIFGATRCQVNTIAVCSYATVLVQQSTAVVFIVYCDRHHVLHNSRCPNFQFSFFSYGTSQYYYYSSSKYIIFILFYTRER